MIYVFSRDEFIRVAKELGRSQSFIDFSLAYADKLVANGLPVIFSRKHLAESLGISYKVLQQMIEFPERYYVSFQIKKKRGGYRKISSPNNQLKSVQRWILNVILSPVNPHFCSKGFKRGDSIMQNAIPHIAQDALLKADLFRFFESISEKKVYKVFKSLGYHTNLAVDLAKLCTINITTKHRTDILCDEDYPDDYDCGDSMLPQGAPTSPAIANLVAHRLDSRLQGLAQKLGIRYTRYADDLTFSGERGRLPRIKLLRDIVQQEGFFLNNKKTSYRGRGQQRKVTGLIVSGNAPRIPRSYKRNVFWHLHNVTRIGPEEHMKNIDSDKAAYRDWLLGRIMYIKSIEPDIGRTMLHKFNLIKWPFYE